jgi:peroxiredoxin
VNKKSFLLFAIGLLVISLTWFVLTPVLFKPAEASTGIAAPHPGFSAPDFNLPTKEGTTLSLSDYEGQPVLVFFWASWCSVCKRTMPGLQSVYDDYRTRGFEILAVNTTYQDSYISAFNYFTEQNYSFPFLIDDDGSTSRAYKTHALPTSVLVGPDGTVLEVIIGAGMSEGYLQSQLDQILSVAE